MRRRLQSRDERGFALVMLAGCLLCLVAAAAFAIDIGAWFLRTSQIQRAADAASLAGAAKMPDVVAAKAAATAAAQRNGFVAGDKNGDIQINYEAVDDDQYNVRIIDKKAPMYFAQVFMGDVQLAKTSKAEFVDSVPMGSPYNALGMGDIPLGSGIETQNYWLAVNGYCLPKEDGDLFSAGFDGTVELNPDGSYKRSTCKIENGSTANLDYQEKGYDYLVNVPPSAGPVDIQVYDPAFKSEKYNPTGSGIRPSGGVSPDVGKQAPYAADKVDIKVTTSYTLFDTKGTAGETDDVIVSKKIFLTDDPTGIDKYVSLGQVVAPTGSANYKFRVQVSTLKGEPNSVGVNAFGIRAVGTAGKICNTRVDSSCPAVYGKSAISLFASLNPGSTGYVDLYLAQISSNYAGKPLQVALWDLGEGASSVRLLNPQGAQQTFSYQATPAPSTGASGSTNNLSVSNPNVNPPGPNRSNRYIYNDRLVVMGLQLPNSYATNSGDGWWKLRYYLSGSLTERATWSASVENGDPVHLVRN